MARKKKEPDDWSLDSMLDEMSAGLSNAAKKPNNYMYKADPQQMPFHASERIGKLYIGGNRSGKTTGGVNEDIFWLRGEHPYRSVPPPPVIGRICTVDFKNGAEKIIIPQLRQWVPPSLLINGSWEDSYNGNKHVLSLENGSELEIMSYDQDLDKFAGVPRHFTHFDEEPPKNIFEECKLRLIDYDGSWWMTMTPIDGMTWVFDEIYEGSEDGSNPLIEIVHASPYGNSHLRAGAIDNIMSGLDEDGRSIRGTGKFVAIGGLVFKHYDPETHVIAGKVPPSNWTHYISLDAGYNNPAAVLWHAVGPDGVVVTYDEIYVREMTVQQISELITEKETYHRNSYGIVTFLKVADPAIKQRQQTTGLSIQIEYGKYGHNFATGSVRSVDAGLDKMNDYLRLNKWLITEKCPNLQKEMRTYQRAMYSTAKLREKNNRQEVPKKKNDHACDSSRYFFSFMPELDIQTLEQKPLPTPQEIANLLDGAGTIRLPYNNIDTNLVNSSAMQEQHFVTEIGEF